MQLIVLHEGAPVLVLNRLMCVLQKFVVSSELERLRETHVGVAEDKHRTVGIHRPAGLVTTLEENP